MDERQGRIIIGVTIGVLIIIISILIYIGVTTGTKKDQFLKTADEFEKAGEQYFHDEDIL
ncbi:MAG TPA: hypothetical protein GX690_02510, partial [Tenericutes bacterium]|nr:hypothetical protein [Mycoplasmatota bacterium]